MVAGHAHDLAVDSDDLVELLGDVVERVGVEDDLREGDGAVAVRALDVVADLMEGGINATMMKGRSGEEAVGEKREERRR